MSQEPAFTDAASAEPKLAEPKLAEPKLAEPKLAEPAAAIELAAPIHTGATGPSASSHVVVKEAAVLSEAIA